MSDREEEIEKLLQELKPAEASPELEHRIARELAETLASKARSRGSLIRWASLAVVSGMAAVLAWMIWRPAPIEPSEDRREVAGPKFGTTDKPAEARFAESERFEFLVAVEPSSVFRLEDGRPARSYYIKYLDTVVLREDGGTATLTMTRPREEYCVVPLATD